MSKFISKLKELSNKVNSAESGEVQLPRHNDNQPDTSGEATQLSEQASGTHSDAEFDSGEATELLSPESGTDTPDNDNSAVGGETTQLWEEASGADTDAEFDSDLETELLSQASGTDTPDNDKSAVGGVTIRWWEKAPGADTDAEFNSDLETELLSQASGTDTPDNDNYADTGVRPQWWEQAPRADTEAEFDSDLETELLSQASGTDTPDNDNSEDTGVTPKGWEQASGAETDAEFDREEETELSAQASGADTPDNDTVLDSGELTELSAQASGSDPDSFVFYLEPEPPGVATQSSTDTERDSLGVATQSFRSLGKQVLLLVKRFLQPRSTTQSEEPASGVYTHKEPDSGEATEVGEPASGVHTDIDPDSGELTELSKPAFRAETTDIDPDSGELTQSEEPASGVHTDKAADSGWATKYSGRVGKLLLLVKQFLKPIAATQSREQVSVPETETEFDSGELTQSREQASFADTETELDRSKGIQAWKPPSVADTEAEFDSGEAIHSEKLASFAKTTEAEFDSGEAIHSEELASVAHTDEESDRGEATKLSAPPSGDHPGMDPDSGEATQYSGRLGKLLLWVKRFLKPRSATELAEPLSRVQADTEQVSGALELAEPTTEAETDRKAVSGEAQELAAPIWETETDKEHFSSEVTELAEPPSEVETDTESVGGEATQSAGSQGQQKLPLYKRILNAEAEKPLYRRKLFWAGMGVISLSSGATALGWVWWRVDRSLPDVSSVFSFARGGTLTIKAVDGKILQQSGPATREKLKINDIPQRLVDAFIASEDRRFYKHKGIDFQGVFRAIASNVLAGDVVEGGSTITQQLARVVFLNQERSAGRKVREALLAWKIENKIKKEEILERYLNLVYLGSGAYGVADAAWVYFSKSVKDLTLGEIATIAGLPPAPSAYSPLENPKFALQRRNVVLQRMVDAGYITQAEAAAAIAQPLAINPSPPKRLVVESPYFTSYIRKELPKYVSVETIEMGGLTVETTLNREWQKVAEQVVKDAVELDGPAWGFDQAALVAIDPRTGEIKAMVGGRDFKESEFNRVTQAQRSPGSTFKTFVYTAAIAAGFSPYDGYEDARFTVDGYKPHNYNRKYRGWTSMIDAIASSVNVVAVKVLMDVGFEPTIKLAHDMGIKSELEPTYSLALGKSEVNLLEITSAYGTLAAKGKHVPAHGIIRITNQRGQVIYDANFQPKQAVDKNTAAIVTWMLEQVVLDGTATPAQLPDRQVAGKTGTTDEAKDLWFIGYIPQLATGVWLGNDDNYPTWGSSKTAAFNWREFMNKVVEGMAVEEFPPLPNLEGRKGSIKAKPVTPNYTIYGNTLPDDAPANAAEYSPNRDAGSQGDGFTPGF